MRAEDIAAVARVIELLGSDPPKAETWDSAQLHGKPLHAQVQAWLKEKL